MSFNRSRKMIELVEAQNHSDHATQSEEHESVPTTKVTVTILNDFET